VSALKGWFEKTNFGASARNAYIRDFKQFFGWCAHKNRNWITLNPCEQLERRKIRREAPLIYTPDEAGKLLLAAWHNPKLEMLGWYAIGLLSGVRVEELGRVHWAWVDLEEKSGCMEREFEPKHPGGRPTKRTPEITDQICEAISYGLTDEEVAAMVGIDDSTLTRWKKDPEFCGAIKKGRRPPEA
jgi:integrase